jgi:SET domain-containing protein
MLLLKVLRKNKAARQMLGADFEKSREFLWLTQSHRDVDEDDLWVIDNEFQRIGREKCVKWLKIFMNNSFAVDEQDSLYFFKSFFNHSCRPNCSYLTVEKGGVHSVIVTANEPIKKGTELTLNYYQDLVCNPSVAFRENFAVSCKCGSCFS